MTNQSGTQSSGFNANTTLQQMYQMGLRIAQNVCAVVTAPVEYALRPFFGTRFFDPIQMIFTWILMLFLPLAGAASGYLPSRSTSEGLIGLGTFSVLFFASHFFQGPRIWWLMTHMEREEHSEFEGHALSPFTRLPFGNMFWAVRIVHEPVAVAFVAVAMHLLRVFDQPLMVYLLVAALMLSTKNFLAWYQNWLHLRILMDGKFAAPLVAKAAAGKATERELAQVHMAGFPKGLPADVRTAAIAQMAPRAPSLPADIANLVSPIETGVATAA